MPKTAVVSACSAMTDAEKASGLQRVGWRPAGSGDGPLGELEWWAPPTWGLPKMVYSFADAVNETLNRLVSCHS